MGLPDTNEKLQQQGEINNNLEQEVAEGQAQNEENRVQRAEKRANNIVNQLNKINRNIQAVFTALLSVVKFLISPPGWITITTAILFLTFYSGSEMLGRQEFGSACSSLGSPILENIHDPKIRIKTTMTFFMENGWSAEQASGLTAYLFREAKDEESISKIKFDKTATHKGICDNNCLESAIEGKKLVQAGVFKVSGETAKSLVKYAKKHNQPWYKSEVQLAFFATHLRKEIEEKNKDELIKMNEDKKKYIQFIAVKMGSLLNAKSLDELISNADSYKSGFDKEINGCKVLGDGTEEGRLGNAEVDSDLDVSDMLKLAEQITTPEGQKVETHGTYGGELLDTNQYTKAYKKAKDLAMKNSEASTQKEDATVEPQPHIYASCDRFVATILKATKADIDIPWGDVFAMRKYMKAKTEKYKPVGCNELKPGDILTFDGGTQEMQHIALYGNEKRIYEASHQHYLPSKNGNGITCSGKDGTDGLGRKLEAFRLIKKGS